MILGLFIRNFKTYQGIHFVPLSNKHKFCGLLGNNGIGKSSVLEALDSFFNNRKWNYNNTTKRSGKKSRPYIVPIFAIEKNIELDSKVIDNIKCLDRCFRNIKQTEINIGGADNSLRDIFLNFYNVTKSNVWDNYYIFPIGVDHEDNVTFSILDSIPSFKDIQDKWSEDEGGKGNENIIIKYIKESFDYVYIPKDINSEVFTQLETEQMQVLMGESLSNVLNNRVTKESVSNINKKLNEFIDQLEFELPGYVYRTATERQTNIRKRDINDLIIGAFFNTRKLHKKQDDNVIEISALSSGEKQKAIIDVAHSLLRNHRKDGANLIIAIDEPESSLHISACFEQFSSLFDMSMDCRQLIFSSHWYGFLPILNDTNICFISKNENTHLFDLVDLTNYREDIIHKIGLSEGKLPYNISLKSIADLVQSIIVSIVSDTPYNWLICEGSSEKIYLEKYFEHEVENIRLRIIPVGGAKKVKDLYKNLSIPYEELKDSIGGNRDNWGKIYFLSDTDSQFIDYETNMDDNNFCCRRIINDSSKKITKLVKISSNPKSPETEIEDCLNGKLFVETLVSFSDKYPIINEILTKNLEDYSEGSSGIVLDLRPTEREKLKNFFDANEGMMKIEFAEKYVSKLSNEYKEPEWIVEIKNWLNRNKD